MFNFSNTDDENPIAELKNAIKRGIAIDSMQDSTVYLSHDRKICRRFNYEDGAAIKVYLHKGRDYYEKVLLYQQATEVAYNSLDNEPQTISTPFGEKNVRVVPIDVVYYDEQSQTTYAVSAFKPGYNMAYREFEDDIPDGERITHEQWRLFEFFTVRLQHHFEHILERIGIHGISLSSSNFMLPIQDKTYPGEDIFITDMSDNIAYIKTY